ncbi:MAG TPA: EAL domain-containing protein [Solirubrobacteraceae bacterium]
MQCSEHAGQTTQRAEIAGQTSRTLPPPPKTEAMALLDGPTPIEASGHILRARRTAALTRVAMGIAGIALVLAHLDRLPHSDLGMVGFSIILAGSLLQLAAPRLSWLALEESVSGLAGVLIIGFGPERVSTVNVLWLVAVASGVMARGGRVHFIGRYIVLCSLTLPIVRYGGLSGQYAGFFVASLSLLLTSGRLTSELNVLLRQARLHADSVETLLLAGDIASRMSERVRSDDGERTALEPEELDHARTALARLVEGEGLSIVVQPIVDIRTGTVHAYEALARFGLDGAKSSPLHWFTMAEQLGGRPALERACLREVLELFPHRPAGTSLSVNLSAPVLLEPATMAMLASAAETNADELNGLIIEITEETLVRGSEELAPAVAPLRRRGAQLAVDDMGAGYSGLRQVTTVRPNYLKLDRALVSGIHTDLERSALVGALVGYSEQVGGLLIAEGIEHAEELEELRRLRVPLVQGFHFARPGEPWPEVGGGDEPKRDAEPLLAAEGAGGAIDPSEWLDRAHAPAGRRQPVASA